MPVTKWWSRAREVPGTPRARGLGVMAEDWSQCAGDVAASGGRLLAMWASPADSPDSTGTFEIEDIHEGASGAQPGSDATSARAAAVYAAFLVLPGVLILELPVRRGGAPDAEQPDYPGIEALF